MKKVIAIVFLAGGFVACEQSPWSEEEKDAFMDECREQVDDKSYCNCYMEQVMAKYPQAEDSEEMSFEEAVELSKDCQ